MSGPRATGGVLIVDDEKQVADSARLTLRSRGFTDVTTCNDPTRVEALIAETPPAVVLLDLTMPRLSGRTLLPRIRAAQPEVAVIVVTANDDVRTVVDCMHEGAVDYLVKPVSPDLLEARVARALADRAAHHEAAQLRRVVARQTQDAAPADAFAAILTADPAMRQLFGYIEAIARGTEPVLILGESGTGKELVARALHRAGRRSGPFVAVNVAGLSDAFFDDRLFGHAPGAFTGAGQRRAGAIEGAGTGTLFLDEIGDLPESQQVKLLRVLQENEYVPLGADRALPLRARILAATHQDPRRLRADLYFRLRGYQVAVPPLRERLGDLEMLAARFAEAAATDLGRPVPTIAADALAALRRHTYPGNVRELRSVLFHAVAVAGDAIGSEHVAALLGASGDDGPGGARVDGILTDAEVQALERENIVRALQRCGWQIAGEHGAAALLGLKPSTLASRVRKLGIERPEPA